MLLARGWIEQPADGVLTQLCFEFPTSLVDRRDVGFDEPDGIHPATVLLCARSTDAGSQYVEIHVELAGRDPGAGACADHATPWEKNFQLDDDGFAAFTGQLDEIEQHVANWADIVACADGPGRCA